MTANELHESLKHNGGFTKHYNKTNMLIGTKITINDRHYKITANDLLLLNYLIGWQITDEGSLNGCYEANATIANKLNISINTLLDSYRKLKALNLISAQQVNGKLCRMFVDCDRLAELLNIIPSYKAGYEHILDTIDKKQNKKKGFRKQQDDDEKENPF